MSKFKEGDLVIDIPSGFVIQAHEDMIYKDFKLWQPQEGEWCWYMNIHHKNPQLREFKQSRFNQDTYHGLKPLIEPFIGELPSFIKE